MEALADAERMLSGGAGEPGIRCERFSRAAGRGGCGLLGFFRLDATHVGFFAVDVMESAPEARRTESSPEARRTGQGLLQTLLSLLLRTLLSADPLRGGILVEKGGEGPRALPPAAVAGELARRFFLEDDPTPQFTLAYGVSDPATGATRLVRAGSPAPVLQKADGTIRLLEPAGLAVGLSPQADAVTEEFLLDKGDRLLLCTDGVVQCRNPSGERFSARRLAERVSAHRGESLGEMLDSLGAELEDWRGGAALEGDLSLLALEKE
jgi:sigma-B regulation protein RsbU (phosphoserine phosphatase)